MASQNFLLALVILFHLQKAEAKSMAMASPDSCQRKCGQIEIPYPFGMNKEHCYLDETFKVECNASSGTASLAWLRGHQEIDSISISNHTLRIKNSPVVDLSFNKSGVAAFSFRRSGEIGYHSYENSHYFTSFVKNKFVMMGCDFYGYLVDEDTREFLGGCAPLCNRTDIVTSPSSPCSGLRCCEVNLPIKGVKNMGLWFETMNTLTKAWEHQCGFFTFMDNDFAHLLHNIEFPQCNKSYFFPMTYEWAVGNISCNEAKGRRDYVCGRNTNCFNNDADTGYRCKCLTGYRGNPYLPDGCQDIDECLDTEYNVCPENNDCVNTEGSYICSPIPRRFSAMLISSLRKYFVRSKAGISTAVGLLLLFAIGFWSWRKLKQIKKRKMKQKFFKKNGGVQLQQQLSSRRESVLPEFTLFKIEELEKATDKFSENRILGKGGLGTVYKGMLSDGRIVAVKKANTIDHSQVDQFINEVFILSHINHRNIVKLFGGCLETEVPLLVYEYVSNGTLSNHLHDEPDICRISWENRLRIVAEVAGALAYLHSCATTAIFHRDIKSSNILLDQDYKAVISDFGLSRSVSIDKTHLTTLVGGTFGYLDPEYFRSGQLNDKSDVYAFGVVLAEMLTGQKAISSAKDDIGLALRFRSAVKEQRLFEILEDVVASEGKKEEIVVVAKLAKRCLKVNARNRPSMKEVAAELEQVRKTKEVRGHDENLPDMSGPLSENSYSCSIDSIV